MKSFKGLDTGDIVRHVNSSEGYVVHGNFGSRVTAVRIADLTNPDEWDLIFKATHNSPSGAILAKDESRLQRDLDQDGDEGGEGA